NDLQKAALCSNNQCQLPGIDDGHYVIASASEVTSWALQALLSAHFEDANFKDSLVRWLLLQRKGGVWRDTRETAAALYALADYAKGLPGVKSGVNAMLSLNDQPLEKVAVAAAHFVRNVAQPPLKTGNNQLGITNPLSTPLYYQTDLESFTQ